jgi:hypothetical protein
MHHDSLNSSDAYNRPLRVLVRVCAKRDMETIWA